MVKYSYDRRANDTVKIEIELTDGDSVTSILKLLKFLRYMGQVGTSRSLRLTDNETTITGWDGDGASQIKALRLNGKEVDTSKDESDAFKKMTR